MVAIGDFDSVTTPPMVNGEVQFAEPWQGRVFGMARSLAEAGCYSWDEFRDCLIEQLQDVASTGDDFAYYDHFQAALETLLTRKGLVQDGQLRQLTSQLAARPHGHDHGH